MRIGIDCRTILNPKTGERAGVGHYSYYLVKNLLALDKKNEYVLFFDYRFKDPREFQQRNVKIRYFPFSQYKKFLPFSYSHMLITAFLNREKLDIFHSPANVIPYTYSRPSIVTVHDLAIYRHPEWFPRGQKFSVSILVPHSLQRARRIIGVSQATKNDIVKIFKIPEGKIKVIHEGMKLEKCPGDAKGLGKKYGLPGQYLLYVGTLEPRKNLVRLVSAYHNLIARQKHLVKYKLVLAGHRGWQSDLIFKKIKELGLTNQVAYLNYIPHLDKLALIKNATAFVFPTLYEGFGLPVLEAMCLGTPVITSNVASIPEVAGQAAFLINPRNERELTEAMRKVLNSDSLRQRMSSAGLVQAKKFSWHKCAEETLKVYAEEFAKIVQQRKKKEQPQEKNKKAKVKTKTRKK
ncbi:MAG: glycosyltransferase family 1 protein [Patescibacteria group bacterium]|nr:glycosyltransferase family 1 protein [Patescibacteria group bacterium]